MKFTITFELTGEAEHAYLDFHNTPDDNSSSRYPLLAAAHECSGNKEETFSTRHHEDPEEDICIGMEADFVNFLIEVIGLEYAEALLGVSIRPLNSKEPL